MELTLPTEIAVAGLRALHAVIGAGGVIEQHEERLLAAAHARGRGRPRGARALDARGVIEAAGLPARRRVVLETAESPLLNLVAISPQVVPPRAAWRGRYEPTGYWFLDEPTFEPDDALRAFLERGPPPVVITFGSMTELDARVRALGASIAEGVRQSGARAVLQGNEELRDAIEPSVPLFVTSYAPHDWLFARSAGVVHHGGAGTSAAALRAGVPQSVYWVFGDQPDWGKRLQKRGVAAAPLALPKLTPANLAERLRAMAGSKMKAQARELGARVASEDSVGRACELLRVRLRSV